MPVEEGCILASRSAVCGEATNREVTRGLGEVVNYISIILHLPVIHKTKG
jgi:hypothetical protein